MTARFGLAESPSGVGIVAPDTYILVSNGDGTWSPAAQGGGGGAVSSVFGRAGAVVALIGDYNSDLIENFSGVTGSTVSDALDALAAAIPTVPVASVFGRVGAVVAVANDYTSSQVDNTSGVSGDTVSSALDFLAAAIPPASISLLELVESGSVDDYFLTGGDTFAIKDAIGTVIECTFAAWNLNDILEAEFWGTLKPFTPPCSVAMWIAVSLDAGATFQKLRPAGTIWSTSDGVSLFAASASASVALATSPIVRIGVLDFGGGLVGVDLGGNSSGFNLRCRRYKAGSYTPGGFLV